MELAPIVLFVYNRPWHTRQTVEALQKNEMAMESDLIIFSDAAKNEKEEGNVSEVRRYIQTIGGFKAITIHEASKNKGLASSIIAGVTEVINQYGKAIVLEDDLITSKYFLLFINKYLDSYQDSENIWSISGYSLPINLPNYYNQPVYLSKRSWSWGFGTWKSKWEKVDWSIDNYKDADKRKFHLSGGRDLSDMLKAQSEGKIDSWYVRWQFNQHINHNYCIYPRNSLIQNIGHDGTGIHCTSTLKYSQSIHNENIELVRDLKFDTNIQNSIYHFNTGSATRRFILRVATLIGIYNSLRKFRNGFII